MKAADLGCDFQTSTGELPPETQKLFRTLAPRCSQLLCKLVELLQPALVKLPDVIQSFDRPLQVLFTAILVLFSLHLVGECNDVADVECTGGQLVADPEKFNYCNRRTRNRLLGAFLTALDALRDRHFLLTCK